MKIKSLLLFSVIGLVGGLFAFNSLKKNGDPNVQKEAILIRSILDGLDNMHYQPKAVDDAFSAQLYDLYLENTDGGKRFLTQQDIDQFSAYRNQLDDQAKEGTFAFFDQSLQAINASVTKTKGYYTEILAQPFNFDKEEQIETDGKKLKWAKDDADLKARWAKSLKFEVLDYIAEETEKQEKADFKGEKKSFSDLEKEGRKKTTEKYDRFYKRLAKMDRDARLEIYLNSITNIFDPHTGYFSPKDKENFDIQMSGKLEGIGARL